MKKIIVGFFLVASMLFIGLVVGGFIGSKFFTSPHDGLAGGAIVFFYALIGAAIALAVAITMLVKMSSSSNSYIAVILTITALVGLVWFQREFPSKSTDDQVDKPSTPAKVTSPAAKTATATNTIQSQAQGLALPDGTQMGIGIAAVQPIAGKKLNFYSKPEHHHLPENLTPLDSITFKDARHFVDIATAPPWFVPHYMKLDYNLLHLVVITAQKNWLEVVVNRTNGQTAWVYAPNVEFSYWPDFLLKAYSLELLIPDDYPPRIKPMDHASPATNIDARGVFHPISVKGEWLQVHPDHEVKHEVWVRWKRNGVFLVSYSLLS